MLGQRWTDAGAAVKVLAPQVTYQSVNGSNLLFFA